LPGDLSRGPLSRRSLPSSSSGLVLSYQPPSANAIPTRKRPTAIIERPTRQGRPECRPKGVATHEQQY
jgi:hypothetical protein